MIELRGISKHYARGSQKAWVLRDVNLTVRPGEFVSIVGPSGSGKSTLLHLLGLLDEPSAGEYLLDGVPVGTLSEKQRTVIHRERIGFVFQAYHLLDELTVAENIETPLLYQKRPGPERKARVAEMLDRFGMVAKKDLFPAQLSGGQQQLVGVARALVTGPALILADEPTGNLHSSQGEIVLEAFRDLNRRDGVTVVQVTHSDKAAAYGDRVVELLDGRVVRDVAVEPATTE
ncbi:MAG TPA: ABC transporter ATP-binding protein [Rubricoccaceae bacterium]